MAEEVTLENEIDPNVIEHMNKMSRSMLNDFFDGEQAIMSEQFYRWITKQPLLTKEEVQERTKRWVEKEEEIWNAGNTKLRVSE